MIVQDRARWRAIAVASLSAAVVAAVGAALTDLGPWYQSLHEPSWKPPDEAFGPIWTTIFTLCVIASVRVWRRQTSAAGRRLMIGLCALNGFLNILWTVLFFDLQRPDLALEEVATLWASILVLIIVFFRRSRLASVLLWPYLAWVSLAAALNYQVVALNGPFG